MNVFQRLYYSARYRLFQLRDYTSAVYYEPRGAVCGWCKWPNFFCDDCGWMWISPDATLEVPHDKWDTRACCGSCWRGPLGQKHVAFFGLGDR